MYILLEVNTKQMFSVHAGQIEDNDTIPTAVKLK